MLGKRFPWIQGVLNGVKLGQTSLPIAVGLMMMMLPVLAKVRFEELSQGFRHKTMLPLCLLLGWGVGPALMFSLAWLCLADQESLRTGMILIGIAPCIAMVLIWVDLAEGDREDAALLVIINAFLQTFGYTLLANFYLLILPNWLGLKEQSIIISTTTIGKAVLIFLSIPLVAGLLIRWIGLRFKGKRWYEERFLPRLNPCSLIGLLYTIVVMFALQGEVITSAPLRMLRVALPLLLFFSLMWGLAFAVGHRIGLPYRQCSTLAFASAGNNFELAIAVSVSVWGVTSGQALAGVIGTLIEVRMLMALVYLSLWLRGRLFPSIKSQSPAWRRRLET
jgi:ACR3 family arsenite transporter